MRTPTLALCVIAKNEEHNVMRMFESIKGCFDIIHFTDTGSTDRTVEIAQSEEAQKATGCPIKIHHFEWCNDFAKARNYSFSHAETDFIMWLDLDDVLSNRDAFIKWKQSAMGLGDYWLAPYDYFTDKDGKVTVSFTRERVVRRTKKIPWKYFIHEGMMPEEGQYIASQFVNSWRVTHLREAKDVNADRGRNLNIFKKQAETEELDARMKFYYGKELFDAGRPMDGFRWLMESITENDLSQHDRILGIQYAAQASQACGQWEQSIQLCMQGIALSPLRAEFYVMAGDAYVKVGKVRESIPFYEAAKNCPTQDMSQASPIFSRADAYMSIPSKQLARVYYNIGMTEKARECAETALMINPRDEEAEGILREISQFSLRVENDFSQAQDCDDLVITCPPNCSPYEWDDKIYKDKGIGGSETAAVEVAEWIKKKTGRRVIVFHTRSENRLSPNGVEYRKVEEMPEYFKNHKPKAHLAWRHTAKLTDAKTFVWCHDLITPELDKLDNYDKVIALTQFHKNYLEGMAGVPSDKILVSRNGIDPERFRLTEDIKTNPNKIIFSSSPDRGLEYAIQIVEKARETEPDLELHVFYGFENLKKSNQPHLKEIAHRVEGMIQERDWVKYHGNVTQSELAIHMREASIWLYPATFIETFCITALEALSSGTYPLARDIGALTNTLGEAANSNMARLLDLSPIEPENQIVWAKALCNAIRERRWENVKVNTALYSWESVSEEFIRFLDIPPVEIKMPTPRDEKVRSSDGVGCHA